jgi:hypothetical protein
MQIIEEIIPIGEDERTIDCAEFMVDGSKKYNCVLNVASDVGVGKMVISLGGRLERRPLGNFDAVYLHDPIRVDLGPDAGFLLKPTVDSYCALLNIGNGQRALTCGSMKDVQDSQFHLFRTNERARRTMY